MTQLDWKKGMSRTYNREYWYNRKTGESMWKKPAEVLEYEKQERQKQIAMHVEEIESVKKLEEEVKQELEKKRKQAAIKARRKEYLKQLQEKKQAQKEADQKEADQNQPSDPEEARRKARMMERVRYLANEYMPSSISCRNTSSSPSSYSMQIANNNGGSWTIEGQSHWTREDYMDELRNINQSLRDY